MSCYHSFFDDNCLDCHKRERKWLCTNTEAFEEWAAENDKNVDLNEFLRGLKIEIESLQSKLSAVEKDRDIWITNAKSWDKSRMNVEREREEIAVQVCELKALMVEDLIDGHDRDCPSGENPSGLHGMNRQECSSHCSIRLNALSRPAHESYRRLIKEAANIAETWTIGKEVRLEAKSIPEALQMIGLLSRQGIAEAIRERLGGK